MCGSGSWKDNKYTIVEHWDLSEEFVAVKFYSNLD